MRRAWIHPVLCAALIGLLPSTALGIIVLGPDGRQIFEDGVNEEAGFFFNFDDQFSPGTALNTQLLEGFGVSFASVRNIFGNPFGPVKVQVTTDPVSGHNPDEPVKIVGAPSNTGGPDGRVGYDIMFETPQRWAGVLRLWNADTLTTFYSSDETLLAEISGPGFIGFYADGEDVVSQWIARIEIDTIAPSTSRQVGYTDDLFFGTGPISTIPEPATTILLLVGLGVMSSLVLPRLRSGPEPAETAGTPR